jgi:hypothetical protein
MHAASDPLRNHRYEALELFLEAQAFFSLSLFPDETWKHMIQACPACIMHAGEKGHY